VVLLVVVGCNPGSVSPITDDPVYDPPPPPDEICNGDDDDGDGEVDEGFADVDGDGVMDCVDQACRLPEPRPVEVSLDPTCPWAHEPTGRSADLVRQWHWSGLASDPAVRNVMGAPVVGPLVDSNTDGRIDRADRPSVAAVAFAAGSASDGVLVVLDGVTGELQWSAPGWTGVGALALGDLDHDGHADLVGFDPDSRVQAVRGSGEPLWTGPLANRSNAPLVALADLDADGTVEVLADDLVLDGRTGELLARLDATPGAYHRGPSAVDLDGDGQSEILFGSQLFDPHGELLWQAGIDSETGAWSAPVRDPQTGELRVVFVADRHIEVRDATGARISSRGVLSSAVAGPACVADFDGDDAYELVLASQSRVCLFELDGTERWCSAARDRSGLAGCSAYDLDGSGTPDVLYASEEQFIVLSGPSGSVRFEDASHGSGTLVEYPVAADIDDDGSAEIVVGSNDAWEGDRAGLTAWTHREDALPAAGRVWGQHAFAPGIRRRDGRVAPRLDAGSGVRVRPASSGLDQDLGVAVDGACAASCADDGLVRVQAQVHNSGSDTVNAGVPVSLYARSADGLHLLDSKVLREPVPPGGSVPVRFRTTPVQIRDGLQIRVDDDGTVWDRVCECDESNNTATWEALPCG